MSGITLEKLIKAKKLFEDASNSQAKYQIKFGCMVANSEQIKEYFDFDVDPGLYTCYDDGRIIPLRD